MLLMKKYTVRVYTQDNEWRGNVTTYRFATKAKANEAADRIATALHSRQAKGEIKYWTVEQ